MADEKALVQLENEWSAVVQAADVATIERILADDYVQVRFFGDVAVVATPVSPK